MPLLTFRTTSNVKRSKVKVIRPLWVAVQVTTCRGSRHCGDHIIGCTDRYKHSIGDVDFSAKEITPTYRKQIVCFVLNHEFLLTVM